MYDKFTEKTCNRTHSSDSLILSVAQRPNTQAQIEQSNQTPTDCYYEDSRDTENKEV